MKVTYEKLIGSFAIIPHIDLKWIISPQLVLYYIGIAWLRWSIDIDIFYKIMTKKEEQQ